MIKIVHYINQFYAGVGGEDKADVGPEKMATIPPISNALKAQFKGEADVVATVYCGDSYFAENTEAALESILAYIKEEKPDLVVTGPAFNAGRYGVAAGNIAAAVTEKLGIKSISGMYIENPGADMFKGKTYIVSTRNSAVGMKDALPLMAKLALKLVKGEEIGSAEEEGYISRGVRVPVWEKERGARRAVNMLLNKLNGEEYITEFPMPMFDKVDPNAAIKDITKAKVALVTSGGIVPKGNPDHIESSSASHYGKYDIDGVSDLTAETFQTAHGGYDPVYANDDADRVLPVDIMRDLEKEGKIGKLHRYYYSTVGNGTSVANSKKYAEEIAKELVADGVDAVILTST